MPAHRITGGASARSGEKERTIMLRDDADFMALARARTLDVAILLFPEVEVLDFAGPFEVFAVASRIAVDRAHPAFRVRTVAAENSVAARHGLVVTPHVQFADNPPVDVLIVPGGIVHQPL